MEDTLKTLSDFQVQALHKGISCTIDLRYDSQSKPPVVAVELGYSVTGSITKGYVFSTTFTESMLEEKKEHRLASIQHFISTVTEPVE